MFVDLGRGVWWILEDLTALQHRFGQIPGFHVAHAAKKNCHRERAHLVIGDFPTSKPDMTCAISSELNSPPSRFFSISDGTCMIKTRSDEFSACLTPNLSLLHCRGRLESDGMPRGFHFNSIKNPIRIFLVSNEVICDAAPDVTLDISSRAGLQFLTDLVVAAGIDDCIDIHMTCEMRRQLVAISCEKIENAGRKVTRRDDFNLLAGD